MSEVIALLAPRGEYISLLLVATLLWGAIGPLSRPSGLSQDQVGDLCWYGGVSYVVAGRLGYLVFYSPDGLLDPLVVVRLQGGLVPILGIAAALAWVGWRARQGQENRGLGWLAAAAGLLTVAAVAYDLGCVVRDACYGAQAPPPFGFRMSGLSATRLPTPLLEAALLLAWAGVLLASSLTSRGALFALGGTAALLRVALTPASVEGVAQLGRESLVLLLLGLASLSAALRVERARHAARAGATRRAPTGRD